MEGLQPEYIKAAKEQCDRIDQQLKSGAISDPEMRVQLYEHVAALLSLLEEYPELEESTVEPAKEKPKPCPYYQPPYRESASPLVIGKAIPMKKFDYQSHLEKKGWAR